MREKFAFLADLLYRPKGRIFESGGCLHLKDFLSDDLKSYLTTRYIAVLNAPGTYQEVIDLREETYLLNEIISRNPILVQDIMDYVGNIDCDISYYFESFTGDNWHRSSQLVHHDSVGHRIKIFIPLQLGWITYYQLGTHTLNNLSSSTQSNNQRQQLTLNNSDLMLSANLRLGDLFIFDTNGLHKGHIAHGYHGATLVMEFSNFWKRSWQGKVGKRRLL